MLTDVHFRSFSQNGYIVLPAFVGPTALARLAKVCDRLLAEEVPEDGAGKFHALGRGDTLRFLRQRFESYPQIREVLFNDAVTQAAACLLDTDTVFMFNEQYVVKAPLDKAEGNSAFAWHQDGSYVGWPHRPYLTMWVAIDEATEANGALRILPRNLDQDSKLGEYKVDPATNERVCYEGNDGLLMTANPGTLIIFSSVTMHASSPNQTAKQRRAWLCQYSPEPILDPATGAPKHFAIPAKAKSKGATFNRFSTSGDPHS